MYSHWLINSMVKHDTHSILEFGYLESNDEGWTIKALKQNKESIES